MKDIRIFESTGNIINLYDDDDTELEEYTSQLLNLFNSPNIVILETSSGSFIVRPTKVNAIHVNEFLDENNKLMEVKLPEDSTSSTIVTKSITEDIGEDVILDED